MGDHSPDTAKVLTAGLFQAVKWRLQNRSWEDDDIAEWMIISIDRICAHFPFITFDWLVPFFEILFTFQMTEVQGIT